MLQGVKIWVIGVGYLGSALLRCLQEQGALTVGIDIHLQGDAANPQVLQCIVQESGLPQFVFCTQATRGGSVADYDHAYLGVLHALDLVLPQAKLIFCSSASVYGRQDGAVVDESSPCLARGERAVILQKAESRVLLRAGVVARLAALYGPQRSVLLSRYQAGIIPLPGESSRVLNYLHRDDALSALMLLLEAPTGVYNLCGESVSKAQMMQMLAELCPLDAPCQEPPASRRGGCNQQLCCDAMHALAWQPQHSIAAFLQEQAGQTEGIAR